MTTDTHSIPTTCPDCGETVGAGVGIDEDGKCTGCGKQLAEENEDHGGAEAERTPNIKSLPAAGDDHDGVAEVTHAILGRGSKTVALSPGESVAVVTGTEVVTVEVQDGSSD